MAWRRTDIESPAVISGYTPSQLQAAYNLPSSTNGFFQTIAIVDAYEDPKAESDLAFYRSTFSLPPCTTANGCFLKVNESGQTSPLPGPDPSPCASAGGCWEDEEALDLDMASAICPNCHILLVEANDASSSNLYLAEDTAATKCAATEISNSWNGMEYSGEATDDVHFTHPGIPITVASGDTGYPGGFPTASQHVTAVGGTNLVNPGMPGQSETVWLFTGSLCSVYIAQPAWQSTLAVVIAHPTVCTKRINNDVSADGDPSTGVAVYTTYQHTGWLEFGGTSVATPIIAGVYALAGNGASISDGSYSYSHAGLHDVTSGKNEPCGPPAVLVGSYVCNALTGYDGPSGNGTPNGVGAF